MKALKSKNSKAQAPCLVELARVTDSLGGATLVGLKGTKPVLSCIDSRDSELELELIQSHMAQKPTTRP